MILSLKIILNRETLDNANCFSFNLFFQKSSCLFSYFIDAGWPLHDHVEIGIYITLGSLISVPPLIFFHKKFQFSFYFIKISTTPPPPQPNSPQRLISNPLAYLILPNVPTKPPPLTRTPVYSGPKSITLQNYTFDRFKLCI